jgi:hypothetical protein
VSEAEAAAKTKSAKGKALVPRLTLPLDGDCGVVPAMSPHSANSPSNIWTR